MTDKDRLTQLEEDVQKIKNDISRYKGFIGGIIFICSALVTFIMLIKDIILIKMGIN